MGRLRQTFVERTPPVSDPDAVPDPLPSYWPGQISYRQLVEDESIFERYPADFWEAFRNGLEANKGIGALEAWRSDISYASSQRRELEILQDDQATRPPEYVQSLLWCQGVLHGSEPPEEDDLSFPSWGYVIFRTAGYDYEGDEKWVKAKKVWNELIDAQFAQDLARGALGAKKAKDKFQCVWVEGLQWANASQEKMAEYYRTLETEGSAQAYGHYLFLCVEERSMQSLLLAPPKHQRHFSYMPMPYVRAVASDAGLEHIRDTDDEGEDEDEAEAMTSFNVAVESLVSSLYPIVSRQILSFPELAVGVKEDEMWWGGGHVSRKIKS